MFKQKTQEGNELTEQREKHALCDEKSGGNMAGRVFQKNNVRKGPKVTEHDAFQDEYKHAVKEYMAITNQDCKEIKQNINSS